jgi:hypothetical protein
MRITKTDLKEMIVKLLTEQEDPARLKQKSMSASTFVRAGKEGRQDVTGELTPQEQGIIDQVDEFLLNLAKMPNVDINAHKAVVTRALKLLQQLAPKQQQAVPQAATQGTQK